MNPPSISDVAPTDQMVPDQMVPCAGLTCPLGCNTPMNRCSRLDPVNFNVNTFYDQVTSTLTANAALVFNTGTGRVALGSTTIRAAGNAGKVQGGIYWGVVNQGAGNPALSVFGVVSLTVQGGQTMTITGSRVFALYATRKINVAAGGTVVAAASLQTAGPGGSAGGHRMVATVNPGSTHSFGIIAVKLSACLCCTTPGALAMDLGSTAGPLSVI